MQDTALRERRQFLAQVGKTHVAAAGLGALPGLFGESASATPPRSGDGTNAVTIQCCTSQNVCNQNCSGTKVKYRCTCNGGSAFCTGCRSFNGFCYSYSAPFCP